MPSLFFVSTSYYIAMNFVAVLNKNARLYPLSFDAARQAAVWVRESGGGVFKIRCIEIYGRSLGLIPLSLYESCLELGSTS